LAPGLRFAELCFIGFCAFQAEFLRRFQQWPAGIEQWTGQAEIARQAGGVEGCFHFHVVVEITKYIARLPRGFRRFDQMRIFGLRAVAPRIDAISPAFDGGLGVTAGVQLLIAVQAQIKKIVGDILATGPFAGGVGHHQRDAIMAQHVREFRVHETGVADFNGVA